MALANPHIRGTAERFYLYIRASPATNDFGEGIVLKMGYQSVVIFLKVYSYFPCNCSGFRNRHSEQLKGVEESPLAMPKPLNTDSSTPFDFAQGRLLRSLGMTTAEQLLFLLKYITSDYPRIPFYSVILSGKKTILQAPEKVKPWQL